MGVVAEKWLARYRSEFTSYERAADEVRQQLEDALSGRAHGVQMIDVRAKDPDSAAEKISRKAYGRPAQQMTDILGARVVTLFDHSIEQAGDILKRRFQEMPQYSVNKTDGLGPGEVGYRSVHLVLKPKPTGLEDVKEVLRIAVVEVQIRSVISHAWAEIEHSFRYKAGDSVPQPLKRRFDALAGALELIDREFSSIASDLVDHVRELQSAYHSGSGLEEKLSSLRLLGALSEGLRDAPKLGPDGLSLEIEDADRLVGVLQQVDVLTVQDLMSALTRPETLNVVRRYADASGHDIDGASAIVYLGAIVGNRDPGLLQRTRRLHDSVLISALR
ncbi:GTP pyrophosphokinase family protein [Microbacterium sp. NPDC057944]|uniref:GTP pyrophosphokinase n=1 Tax=Microbacterium sp. NPDC057944 TaxID=3346286 RepID=UPI0036D85AA8